MKTKKVKKAKIPKLDPQTRRELNAAIDFAIKRMAGLLQSEDPELRKAVRETLQRLVDQDPKGGRRGKEVAKLLEAVSKD